MGQSSSKANSKPRKTREPRQIAGPQRVPEPRKDPETRQVSAKVDPKRDQKLRQENFDGVLQFFPSLHFYKNCDTVFVIYAHEPEGKHDFGKDYIKWFKDVYFDIQSDRSPSGYGPGVIPTGSSKLYTSNAAGNILENQLCLLPQRAYKNSVRYVIVCGSERLGDYMRAKNFKDYVDEMQREYSDNAHKSQRDICDGVRKVFKKYQDIMKGDFHHVLTELALLNLRNRHERMDSIRPLLISGKYQDCFPSYIVEENTMIRVEQDSGRTAHQCFFKLLAEVAPHQKRLIDALSNAYSNNLKLLDQRLSDDKVRELWSRENARAVTKFTINQDFERLNHRGVEIASVWGAIREYYSDGSLFIKNVSGTSLSVDTNYFDLDIVPYVKPPEQNNAGLFIQQNAISSAPVSLDSLFQARTMPDGQERAPKRILIRGPAGVGKSTICKRIVSKYQKNEALRGEFEWVLWIPLSRLELAGGIKEFFYQEYFQVTDRGKEMAEKLHERIFGLDRLKTLLILDGWDETHGDTEHKAALIARIANYNQVIITSRFSASFSKNLNPFDLELSVRGFGINTTHQYLNILAPKDAKDIKGIFDKNDFLREMAKIPLFLDMICYSWHELKHSSFRSTPTVTMLYQTIVRKLWQKDIPSLGKLDPESRSPFTARTLQAIGDTWRLEQIVQGEVELLGRLALFLTQQRQTHFDLSTIRQTTQQMEQARQRMERNKRPTLSMSLESNLSKLSLLELHCSDSGASYRFIHKTFQEFFAAHRLIQDDKMLDVSLREIPYESKMWTFVAGFLQFEGDEPRIDRFFGKIKHWPAIVVAPCLKEVSYKTGDEKFTVERRNLQRRVQEWEQSVKVREEWEWARDNDRKLFFRYEKEEQKERAKEEELKEIKRQYEQDARDRYYEEIYNAVGY